MIQIFQEISNKISEVIEKDVKVDWVYNSETKKRIEQSIDDIFWDYDKKGLVKLDNDTLEKVIENILFVAIKRYQNEI